LAGQCHKGNVGGEPEYAERTVELARCVEASKGTGMVHRNVVSKTWVLRRSTWGEFRLKGTRKRVETDSPSRVDGGEPYSLLKKLWLWGGIGRKCLRLFSAARVPPDKHFLKETNAVTPEKIRATKKGTANGNGSLG